MSLTAHASRVHPGRPFVGSRAISALLVPVGRALFAAIFVEAGLSHFNPGTIGYARAAGVPLASFLVPASGILASLGGLSVLVGWHARLGALAIIAFLIPVTLTMHAFWAATDAMTAGLQFAMFMKNLGLLGGALLITHFGAGPYSLDARAARREVEPVR
jgi:putative oxidoreductase